MGSLVEALLNEPPDTQEARIAFVGAKQQVGDAWRAYESALFPREDDYGYAEDRVEWTALVMGVAALGHAREIYRARLNRDKKQVPDQPPATPLPKGATLLGEGGQG